MVSNPTKPRLVRREDNKIIAGVASGIADYFNVDPILVRVAFVLLCFAGAIGFVAYGAAWVLIPKEGETRSLAESAVDKVGGEGKRDNTWIWIIVLSIAGVVILANMGNLWDGGGVVWALILMGAGTWLYLQDLDSRKPKPPTPATSPVPPSPAAPIVRPDTSPALIPAMDTSPAAVETTDTTPAAVEPEDAPPPAVVDSVDPPPPAVVEPDSTQAPVVIPDDPPAAVDPPDDPGDPPTLVEPPPEANGNSDPSDTGSREVKAVAIPAAPPVYTVTESLPVTRSEVITRPPKPVPPRRPRSRLGRHTLAAALVLAGVAAIMDNLGTIDLAPVQYGGIVLATLGVGLLIGAFWGRARGLIFLGILMLPFLAMTGLYSQWFDVPLSGDTGERVVVPASESQLDDSYELGAGSLNLDLNDMTWGTDPVSVEASVGFGEINVSVPRGVQVDVTGSSNIGAVSLFEDSRAGFGVDYGVVNGGTPNGPRLTLDLRTFVGQVEVVRSLDPVKEL